MEWYSISERKRKKKEEEQVSVLIWGDWRKRSEISFILLLLCLIASIPGKEDWKCVTRKRWVISAQSGGVF